MKLNKKLGFTLIELLVVITIIGILSTGAVSVFTTQLQGARDATRISDMKIMESALHQLFNDNWKYPDNNAMTGAITPFISKTLKDPKAWASVCWKWTTSNQACQWQYWTQDDTFNLPNGRFKLAVFFEKETNFKNKANTTDWGTLPNMFEIYAGAGGSGTTLGTSPIY